MKRRRRNTLAPTEPLEVEVRREVREPVDPSAAQRAWGAVGAAAGSALLATIVGPMVAANGEGGINLDVPAAGGSTTVLTGGADQLVVYLQPGEKAPEGAPVVRLDPITVVASPRPGTATVGAAPKQKVVYIYLKPGETPPAGAIVQQAGSVPAASSAPATPAPASNPPPVAGGGSGGGGTKPVAPPVVAPPQPVRPPAPPPPATKPSGAP